MWKKEKELIKETSSEQKIHPNFHIPEGEKVDSSLFSLWNLPSLFYCAQIGFLCDVKEEHFWLTIEKRIKKKEN